MGWAFASYMFENFFDHARVLNECNDLHSTGTLWTDERIHLPGSGPGQTPDLTGALGTSRNFYERQSFDKQCQ